MASHAELDVAALAAGHRPDPLLTAVSNFTDHPFPLPVTMVVDGFLITGLLSSEVRSAERIDEVIAHHIGQVEDEARRSAEGGRLPEDQAQEFARLREHRVAEEAAKSTERESGVDGEPGYLTLSEAAIVTPPGGRQAIGTIRVAVSHVAAWWPSEIVGPEDVDTAD